MDVVKVEKEVERQVIKKEIVKEDSYVLSLNTEEAEMLVDIFGNLAGDGKSYQLTSSIYNLLINAGIEKSYSVYGEVVRKCHNKKIYINYAGNPTLKDNDE